MWGEGGKVMRTVLTYDYEGHDPWFRIRSHLRTRFNETVNMAIPPELERLLAEIDSLDVNSIAGCKKDLR